MTNMLKVLTDSPFCENFEDLGVTKSCLVGEDCYVGKCKYFELYIKKTVHISAFWLLIWFSFLQVTNEGNEKRIIRDCMNTTFFKEINPDAPDSGCVGIKYKEGGEVSKKVPRKDF